MVLSYPHTFSNLANPYPGAESLARVFEWLDRKGLTRPGGSYDVDLSRESTDLLPPEARVVGLPCRREEKRKREELDRIKRQYGPSFSYPVLTGNHEQIWQEVRSPSEAVRNLNLKRIPADAMAFYRCFHSPPFEQWGIYLIVPRLLNYLNYLQRSFQSVKSFTPETLAVCVLFEIFHHEFFHHLVEASATTMEILSVMAGEPRKVYFDYRQRRYEANLGTHPHTPLEEALANAYAFNAFSFISRVKAGYVTGIVSLYQKAIQAYWPTEPEGYREAGAYAKSGYVSGAAQLLAMLLGSGLPDGDEPLLTIARTVFPSGHTAFLPKPDIPTYLVGTEKDLAEFAELVPAPNESYTSLFWPGDTTELDEYIQQRKKEEQEAKRRARVAAKAAQTGLQGSLILDGPIVDQDGTCLISSL